MLNKILLTLNVMFLVFVLSVSVGLGVWAYSLNNQLTQARADYQKLKSSDEKLNADYNALNLKSVKDEADLTAAQAQIVILQGQLKHSQADDDALKARITGIQDKVTILYLWEFGTEAAFDSKVTASGDDQLVKLWTTAQKTRSKTDSYKLSDYIVQSIADSTGLNLSPVSVQNG